VSLVLSVDRRSFAPGVPGERKVLILSPDLNKAARVSLEVLDRYGRPLAGAGTSAASLTSAVQLSVQEDALIHGQTERRRVGDNGEVIDGRDDFIRRRPKRR
jgi:hypothetical protein